MTSKAVVDALAAIEDKSGRLTAEQVVEAARDEESPLHGYFVWDDDVAAYQYRLDQARALIRNVRVTMRVSRRTVSAIAYIRDPSQDGNSPGYRSTREVAKDPEASREALAFAFGAAAAHLRRARELASLFKADQAFDELLESVDLLRNRLTGPADRRPTARA